MTVQEGSLNKNQIVFDPSILVLDKGSKHSQHTVHVFSLYFCHICVKNDDNEIFLEFGIFQREKKPPPKNSWTIDNIVVWATNYFPIQPLECI